MTKKEIIAKLGMVPLAEEGGYVKELFRGKDGSYGTIYYLLDEDSFSCMHSLKHDEIWYYHEGPSLVLLLVYDDHDEIRYLGKDFSSGEEAQIKVPAGTFMGALQKERKGWTLVSTSMAPAYDPAEFTPGDFEKLKDRCSHRELLKKLCK